MSLQDVIRTDAAAQWRAAFEKGEKRDADFTTVSGSKLEPLYGPDDVTRYEPPLPPSLADQCHSPLGWLGR